MPFHQQPQSDNDYHRSGANIAVSTSSSSSNSIFPRSASEALFDNTSKFRQLPCRTFISVGTCPYRERCVYLHDPRCICKEAKTKTRRKNKEDVVLDALFWPVMPYPMVAAKLDMNRQPHVIQPYSVPLPQQDQYHKHDATVYSMWMHFVDFCLATSDSINVRHADSAPCYAAPNAPINAYTGEARLKFFQFLSSCNGRVVSREELLRNTGTPVPLPHGVSRHATVPRRVSEEVSLSYALPQADARQHRSMPNERDVYAPLTQQQSVLYARSANSSGTNSQGYNDLRLGNVLTQSNNVIESRGAFGNYNNTSTAPQQQVQHQESSRTMYNSGVSGIHIETPVGSASGHTSTTTSPHAKVDAPTTLSLLMNTVPQTALKNTKLGSMQILSNTQADPWFADSYGLTDTEEDRDSGSSYNSVPVKQFRSVWNDMNEDTAELNYNVLNGLL